ncbi:hypothetical protein IPF86_02610 [Candidatus Nomurabacteria bacterium]|jgi:hypothetical protein|nr:MAG: hypothetical protein IPF86_02610 [Candidatus Nomurabacteria bacterium]
MKAIFLFVASVLPRIIFGQTVVDFTAYYPSAHDAYRGNDKFVKASLSSFIDAKELDELVARRNTFSEKDFYIECIKAYSNHTFTNNFRILHYQTFKDSVLKYAAVLGYSETSIKKLSIHDLVLLSGLITSSRLYYDDHYDPSVSFEYYNKFYPDELLQKKTVVCTQFAFLNLSIFYVLKNHNDNANGTYMSAYSIDSHVFNKVISLDGDGFIISYVDPAQLYMYEVSLQTYLNPTKEKALLATAGNIGTKEEREYAEKVKIEREKAYSTRTQIDHNPNLMHMLKSHTAIIFKK